MITTVLFTALLAMAQPPSEQPATAHTPAAPSGVETGDPEAQFRLGVAYFRGDGVEQDQAKGVELINQAAGAGYAEAMAGMGYLYMAGEGVDKDETKALMWLRKAAAAGSLKAKGNLGVLLRTGKNIQLSNDESLRMLHEAADGGVIEAKSYLGRLYYTGDGLQTQDREKARPYVEAAAEAGNPECQNIMGVISGRGPEAEAWFRRAALQGHAKAQSNLADLMGAASKASTNRIEAVKWLLLAVDQDEPLAKKSFVEIGPNLPPEILEEAREAADGFRPEPITPTGS
jgi:TPR repeat protein